MGTVLLKGEETSIEGSFLKPFDLAPDFILTNEKLETKTLEDFQNKKKVLATVPSIDTKVCKMESKEINDLALMYPSILFLIISKDLPFALDRFCKSAQLNNIILLSDMRSMSNFANSYGVKITSGPLDGLLCRSILFLDESDKVVYSELVSEISSLPNFVDLKKIIEEKNN